jgi:nucleoside-diphosphate-sugar epimerase
MKVFLTGGTGFLGRRIIARLQRQGVHIKGLARSREAAAALEALGVEPVGGSVGDLNALGREMVGYDVAIHAAAPVEFWGQWRYFYFAITRSTEDFLHRAAEKGISRFIYISSESVLQDKKPLVGINETHPYPAEPNSLYGKSKMLAEQAITRFEGSIHRIVLRPTFIWGEGVAALQTMKEKVERGQFMWIDKGELPMETVHVENVAEAVWLACTRGENNGIYNITDDTPVTVREFLTKLLRTQGITPPDKSMPSMLAKPAAALVERAWELFKIETLPPLSRFELSFVAMPRRYDISKAKQELGYKPVVSMEEGLARMSATSV